MEQTKKQIAILLEKKGKKTKDKIWADIARRIDKPKRTLPKVNIWRLNRFAQKQKGKIFVIPGYVLGTGELSGEIKVAALYFSRTAKEKIKKAKGHVFGLAELAQTEQKKSSMVILK